VFSTWLYTGNGATQTITNNIDLSTKGGAVFFGGRNFGTNKSVYDTVRGAGNDICTNLTQQQFFRSTALTAFTSSGFTLGADGATEAVNKSGTTYASWTFRKQPKFFDVVTWTGNGAANRQISHSLGSTPGFIVYKCTSTTGDWNAIARITNTSYSFGLRLNATNAQSVAVNPSSTISTTWFVPEYFTGSIPNSNANGETYVAYLFAHNAGGFGLTGTDNVINCGSYTGNGSNTGPIVTLGYEPQWVLIKKATGSAGGWLVVDNMRGMPVGSNNATLFPNLSNAEGSSVKVLSPTATGFQISDSTSLVNNSGDTYIYIAIRRGPMKVPTTGTSVFAPDTFNNAASGSRIPFSVQAPDLSVVRYQDGSDNWLVYDRLRGLSSTDSGTSRELKFNLTDAELARTTFSLYNWDMDSAKAGTSYFGTNSMIYNWKRAPSFFDVVCYTGDDTNMTINHNLGVVPELLIIKRRSVTQGWFVYSAGTTTPNNYYLQLQSDAAQANAGSQVWNNTATTFLAGTGLGLSASTQTHVAYLFATCAGVSKVFSYTGNGSSQTINCGFTGGARFVMIKRISASGDWYVWDTARGIVSGNDPHLSLNTTAAEVTSNDTIDTDSTGFVVNQVSATNVNVSSATYIGLAVA
jgi:hypothetical protein